MFCVFVLVIIGILILNVDIVFVIDCFLDVFYCEYGI